MSKDRMTPTEREVYTALLAGNNTVPRIKRVHKHLLDNDIKDARRSLRDKGLAEITQPANIWRAVGSAGFVRTYKELTQLERDFLDLYWLHRWVNRFNASQMLGIDVKQAQALVDAMVAERFLVLDENGQYRLDEELSDQDREQMRA